MAGRLTGSIRRVSPGVDHLLTTGLWRDVAEMSLLRRRGHEVMREFPVRPENQRVRPDTTVSSRVRAVAGTNVTRSSIDLLARFAARATIR